MILKPLLTMTKVVVTTHRLLNTSLLIFMLLHGVYKLSKKNKTNYPRD